jgi:hypothetical protein
MGNDGNWFITLSSSPLIIEAETTVNNFNISCWRKCYICGINVTACG